MADAPALGNHAVLRLPEFRKLFAAQAISDVGDAMTFLALMLTVNELTHSPAALAVLAIAVTIPSMAGGILAGALADRVDRRRIMLASDGARAILVLGFLLLGTADRLPLFYALAFVQAGIGTLFSPARGALVARVVPAEGLLAANGVSQTAHVIASVAGATAIGLVWAAAGVAWPAFVLDAASFAASVAIVVTVSPSLGVIAESGRAAAGRFGASVVAGLSLVARSPVLVAVVSGSTIAMLGMGAINVLFLPFLVNVLHESPAWSGPAEGAQTLSMVLAAALVGRLGGRVQSQTLFVVGIGGLGALCAAFYVIPNAPVLFIDLFVLGWFLSPAQIASGTLIQQSVGDEARGRVFGMLQASASTAVIVSTAAAGILADILGIREIMLVAGLVCAGGGVIAAALFRLDRAARPQPAPPAPSPVIAEFPGSPS
jgi:MFS family permease